MAHHHRKFWSFRVHFNIKKKLISVTYRFRIVLTWFIFSFLSFFLFFITWVAQLTHVVEGRLKDAQEEADKEKALKQVTEASLKGKVLGLNVMERCATTAERVLE